MESFFAFTVRRSFCTNSTEWGLLFFVVLSRSCGLFDVRCHSPNQSAIVFCYFRLLLTLSLLPLSASTRSLQLLNLERSLEKLLDLLAVMGESVDEVLRGEKVGDPAVGRLLEETIANVTFVDVAKFRTLFGDSMRDLLMVVYLSKLTQTQLYIAEKLLCVDLRM